MHGSHIRTHYRHGLCFAQGELLPATHDTEGKQSSTIHPIQAATTSPSYDRHSIPSYLCSLIATNNLRALIPVQRDPLEVEIYGKPEHIGHTSAVLLFRFKEPFSILDHCRTAARKGGPSMNNKSKYLDI